MNNQKRYTAKEMREMAGHLITDICDTENECNEYRNTIGSFNLSDCELALRQAADAEEELTELRDQVNRDFGGSVSLNVSLNARLKAVVEECEKINEEKFRMNEVLVAKGILNRILHAARGEESSPQ